MNEQNKTKFKDAAGRVFTIANIVTTEYELNGAVNFKTTFQLVSDSITKYFEFSHIDEPNFEKELSFAGFEKVAEVLRIKTRKDDGVHITSAGVRIAITDLTDEHLLNILPTVRYNIRGYQYREEAELRGLVSTTPERVEKITQLRSVIASKQTETITAHLEEETNLKRFYAVYSLVKGQTHYYPVAVSGGVASCRCPAWHRVGDCKHGKAALIEDAKRLEEIQRKAA